MKVSEFTGGLNSKIDPSLLPANSAVTLINADIASGVLKAMNSVSDAPNYNSVFSAPLAPASSTVDFGKQSLRNFTPTAVGDLPDSTTHEYRVISKDLSSTNFSSVDYSIAFGAGVTSLDFKVRAPLGITIELYRQYLGVWRLIGSVTPDFTTLLSDNVYDISANTATVYSAGNTWLTGVQSLDYYYELRNVDTSSGVTLYSEPFDITITVAAADPTFQFYNTFEIADTTRLIMLRVHTDSVTGVTTRHELPYDSTEGAWIDYLESPTYTEIDVSDRLDGTYQYVSTFYNSVNGYESQPSPVSAEEVIVRGVINVTNILSNSAATHVRIYRVGGTLTQFTRVTEVVNGTSSYFDTEGDIDIDGTLLISDDYNVPVNNLTLLTEANGVLLAAIGSKLYFSKQGLVFAWPTENFIEFKNEITCIQEAANGVIVATATETFVITGNSPSSYSKYPVSGEHGCQSNTSYQKLRNGVIFKSATALVFTSVGEVTVLTEKFFNPLDITVLGSAVHNNTYYAISASDIFVYNLTDGNYYTIGLSTTNIGIVDNKVQALIGGSLYALGEGTSSETLEYLSPVFTDGNHSELKSYKNVYFAIKGTFTVTIYLDGVLEVTRNVVTTKVEAIDVKVPQLKQKAVNIQVGISGVGTVYEYEWKSLGRQNGR
jgi:hypothetical protein